MRVLALGGYGEFGLAAVELLTKSKEISKITITGRNLTRAQKAVADLEGNVEVIQVDPADEARLTTLLTNYDILLNLLGAEAIKELQIPIMRAAIGANIHYVDLSNWGSVPSELDAL